jgi:hypothetical protein
MTDIVGRNWPLVTVTADGKTPLRVLSTSDGYFYVGVTHKLACWGINDRWEESFSCGLHNHITEQAAIDCLRAQDHSVPALLEVFK